ncbi:MAG: peptidyl-prolyl cis-trans isomerase [Myxococcales bacterium]|nr:peptidyl-prolyl cis-trans isomerase [Myxococcales bacterium]MBL0195935.1 peptidyl-prolyl cis-trans isomerase [Myxococcales bacterium]HQY62319.1 peptidyl-prolyl cis-trans isomerase [Polyangiaceae bacterium]
MPPRLSPARLARRVAALALGLCVVAPSAGATGVEDAERARTAAIVVRVGRHSLTVGELEARLALVPRFQLTEFGKTPAEIRQGFLDRVVLPELLLAEGAEAEGIAKKLPWSHQVARARSTATLRAIRATVPSASQITADEVAAYYQANRSFYDSPERVHVFRILVATQADAEALLVTLKKDLTLKAFTDLARDKSLDKATNLRAGNLGFLGPDGSSNEAGLKAEPALVAAAATVKDGELVPRPVAEGPSFAVVWRRGTVAATKRTLEEATPQIRDTLARRKLDTATSSALEALTKAHVTERNDAPLSLFNVHIDDGPLGTQAGARDGGPKR